MKCWYFGYSPSAINMKFYSPSESFRIIFLNNANEFEKNSSFCLHSYLHFHCSCLDINFFTWVKTHSSVSYSSDWSYWIWMDIKFYQSFHRIDLNFSTHLRYFIFYALNVILV
jgi:hypothetical protein